MGAKQCAMSASVGEGGAGGSRCPAGAEWGQEDIFARFDHLFPCFILFYLLKFFKGWRNSDLIMGKIPRF